jgi:hypothetical protein
MTAIPFDTLKYADRLEAAGVPRAQARIQAEALSEVFDLSELVTRDYLDLRLEAVKAATTIIVETAKADTIKWVAGLLIAQAALIAALVKLL